jgi:hypothetical protein
MVLYNHTCIHTIGGLQVQAHLMAMLISLGILIY